MLRLKSNSRLRRRGTTTTNYKSPVETRFVRSELFFARMPIMHMHEWMTSPWRRLALINNVASTKQVVEVPLHAYIPAPKIEFDGLMNLGTVVQVVARTSNIRCIASARSLIYFIEVCAGKQRRQIFSCNQRWPSFRDGRFYILAGGAGTRYSAIVFIYMLNYLHSLYR